MLLLDYPGSAFSRTVFFAPDFAGDVIPNPDSISLFLINRQDAIDKGSGFP